MSGEEIGPEGSLAADAAFPTLKFPWKTGETKRMTVGPHGGTAGGYCNETTWSQTYGLDFGGYFDVYAMAGGKVEDASGVGGCGAYGVRIRHNDTWSTEYCHLSSRSVKPGVTVQAGQKIGYTGRVGCGSCGAHLHLNLRQNGSLSTWNGRVIDGWKILSIFKNRRGVPSTKPVYGQGTAIKNGSTVEQVKGSWQDGYCNGASVFAKVSGASHTKIVDGTVFEVTAGARKGQNTQTCRLYQAMAPRNRSHAVGIRKGSTVPNIIQMPDYRGRRR